MIQRVTRFLSSEARTLERAVSILAVSALLSSLLALLRDRLLAHTFGAGLELDIYYAAFRIPDFIFVTVGALVSVYILIPELSKRDSEGQKNYIDTVVVAFSALAMSVSLIAAVCAPLVLSTLFPHLVGSSHMESLVSLTRILLLQPILLGFSNILAAITQIRARYGLYALSPILYNVGIILGIVVFYPLWGFLGLGWGVVIGAILHLSVQVPSLVSEGFFRRIPQLFEPKALLRTTSISVPRALALSLNQVALAGLTALAATLPSGSIAVFMFAYNLNSVPLAVIGASYSVAAFPTLAAAFSTGKRREFVEQVATAARHVMFWSLPVIALIIVLRAHIVRTVLGSGAFDWTDTRLTAAAFAIFSLGLVAQGILLLLIRGYYAAGNTIVPFIISLLGACGTILAGVVFLNIFHDSATLQFLEIIMRVSELKGTPVLALALAYMIVSILSALALVIHFEHTFGGFFSAVRRTFFEGLGAACAGGFAAYIILYFIGPLTLTSTLLSVFLRGFTAGLVGIGTAALFYWLVNNREYGETIEALRGKLWSSVRPEENVVTSAEEVGP